MQCVNCGAPLELADGRSVLKCDYCQSTRRLNSTESGHDRVVSLKRPAEINCPRCDHGLELAAVDGKPANYCTQCEGILLETHIFAEVTRIRRAAYRGQELFPSAIEPEDLQRTAACPRCQRRMEVHPHYGAGRAVIDSCHRCNLVWLDNSELTSIERTPGTR